jgi:cytoskeleton protein RodZ
MGNFGDTLRQEREFRGITLDAITRVTKISNRHLVALEQEHFDILPGGVFNKSMVREYARVVGLDQEEWVGRYLSAHKSTGNLTDDDQKLRWTGIGVLLLLVAGLSWFVWSYVHKKISLVTPAQVTRTTAAAPQRLLP